MAATRTQIYLSPELRTRIDARMRREGKSMAQIIREALDAYLADGGPDAEEALKATFGALPDLIVPPRSEWDRA